MSDPNLPGAEPAQPSEEQPSTPLTAPEGLPASAGLPAPSGLPAAGQTAEAPADPTAASFPPAPPVAPHAAPMAEPAQPAPVFSAAPTPPVEAPAAPAAGYPVQPEGPVAGYPVYPGAGAPGAPGAGYPAAGYPQQQPPMNTLSIVALVGGFLVNIVGIVCGHIALSQIKRTGERGRGLALAGLIIGYVSLAASVIAVISLIAFAGIAATTVSSASSAALSELDAATEDLEATLPDSEDFGSDTADLPRSPEFCETFNAAQKIQGDPNAMEASAEQILAFEKIAAIESPNQALYARVLELMKDPSLVTSDSDAGDIFADFAGATIEDQVACL